MGRWVIKEFVYSPLSFENQLSFTNFLTFWKCGLNRPVWDLGCIAETFELPFGAESLKRQHCAGLRHLAVPRSRELWFGCSVSMGRFIAQRFGSQCCCQASYGWLRRICRHWCEISVPHARERGYWALSRTRSFSGFDCCKTLLQHLYQISVPELSLILFG